MNLKTILSLGALAATGMVVFGKNKLGSYKYALDSLEFEVDKIKKLRFNSEISFDIDLKIINPTTTAINIPGEQLVIKTIHFFAKNGNKLGVAHPNISNIVFPANGSRLITNIPVQLSLSQIGNNLSEVLDIATNPDNLLIGVDIEAFGKQFTINP